MIGLLQEINRNLIENLKQQNERITEIEAKLAASSASAAQKESTPAPIFPEISEEVVLEAGKDADEDHTNHGIESDPPDASSKLKV
jgi:hypothetical protein